MIIGTNMAHSLSTATSFFVHGHTNNDDYIGGQQCVPFRQSFSDIVAPPDINDGYWSQRFDRVLDRCPATATTPITTTDLQYPLDCSVDDDFISCESQEQLANIFDEYLNGYNMDSSSYFFA